MFIIWFIAGFCIGAGAVVLFLWWALRDDARLDAASRRPERDL